jgi:HK97 family phage major capsid protein
MTDIRPPKDGIRAMPPGSLTGDGKTLFGRIAPANVWTEIDSLREGHFMERHAPGAFTKTFAETTPKILFQHGKDPGLGHRIIAVPLEFGEDESGPFYRAEVLDGLDPLIASGLRAGQYGSSHTFQVLREDWNPKPKASPTNPQGLPERTVREVRVPEMGPVTWPAYADTPTIMRSMSDEFALAGLSENPARLRELVTYIDPSAPSIDAGATPHLEPERRDTDPVTPDPIKEIRTVDYITRDEKAARVAELEAELQRMATEHPGVLPDADQATWDADSAERGTLLADIAAWDNRQAKLAEFASRDQNASPAYSAPVIQRRVENIYDLDAIKLQSRSMDEVNQRTRDNALRSVESAAKSINVDFIADVIENRDAGEEGEGEISRRVLLTGSPVYKRAFNKYLRGEKDLWSPEEQRAAALAVTGTTTTGGYAVPYVFDPTMIHIGAFTAVNPFRAACRTETITNGNNWRTVTVGAVTAAYGTEASAATEQGPTFGQPTYTVQTAKAFATVSIETLQDRPDITTELTGVFAEAKDTLEENQFAVGVGTTVYPMGMFTDTAYTNQDTAGNDATAITDIRLLESALPLRHRLDAAFFMSRSTQRQLEALDTTGYYFKNVGQNFAMGSAVIGNNRLGNTGTQLLGYPIWEVPSGPSTLTTDGAIIVILAAPKSYVVVDRIGMNVEVIQHMQNGATPSFPTLQRGVLCYWRNTAKPINADAGRSLSVQ